MKEEDIEKMTFNEFIKCMKPSTFKVILWTTIVSIVSIVSITATTVTYFESNLRNLSESQLKLQFESQKISLSEECETKIQALEEQNRKFKNNLVLLSNWVNYSNLDKTKLNFDKAVKARNMYFDSIEK
jgi:hypothetical protein